MASRQLRLFKPPQPLVERLGADFFRRVPTLPGVYLMSDATGRLLYIGQSGNLRARLASYRHLHPDRASRKLIRLIHSVTAICWETCASVTEARIRETDLLRVHRPRFNTMNTYPRAYLFIGWQRVQDRFHLVISPQPQPVHKIYGAFKPFSRFAFAALVRCLWSATRQPTSLDQFPHRYLGERGPSMFEWLLPSRCDPAAAEDLLDGYFGGYSSRLLDLLPAAIDAENISPAQQTLHAQDLETLAAFYERGPRRNREIGERNECGATIAPEALDRFLIEG